MQEEVLLSGLVASAISLLVLSLRPQNAADYVYAALFLTCASSILKLRWFVGTLALAAPVAVAAATNVRLRWPTSAGAACVLSAGLGGAGPAGACPAATGSSGLSPQLVAVGALPPEALVHILVAWAVGALMAYVCGEARPGLGGGARARARQPMPCASPAAPNATLRSGCLEQRCCAGVVEAADAHRLPACLPADSNRRQTFVSHKLALGAASKELEEVQARLAGCWLPAAAAAPWATCAAAIRRRLQLAASVHACEASSEC